MIQINDQFGSLIRSTRKDKGIKQVDFARAIKKSPAYVFAVEKNGLRPAEEVALRMINFLGLDKDELFGLLNKIPSDVCLKLLENPKVNFKKVRQF
jgi:transcriptional regulator with XRE-family HTH domain